MDGSRIGVATNYSNVDGSTTNATVNPGASDNLFFFNSTAGAGPLNRRLEVGITSLTFNSMTFLGNAGAIQFDRGLAGSSSAVVVSIGSGGLTLDAGAGPVTFGRLADSGNEQRVIVGAVADFSINNNSASDLTFVRDFDGRLNNTTNVITVAGSGSGNTVFSAGIKANTTGRDLAMVINTTGSGAVRIEGTGTYTGGTTLEQGTLQVRGSSALGTGALTINGGTLASYVLPRTLANNVTVGGNFTLGGSGHDITLNGTMDLGGGARVITTANAATLGGVVSNGGITKQGAGALTLTASNTYTGATTVAGGTLRIDGNSRLGNTAATLTISNAGVLEVTAASTLTNAITIGSGDGVLLNSSSGALVVAGNVSKDGTILTSRSGTGTNVFTGVISGASASSDLVVDGGTTVFSNVMTYNGPTIITNGGTLVLAVDDAMPSGSDLILGGGTFRVGVLDYNADSALSMGTLTLTANSTIDLGGFGTSGDRNLVFADSSAITWASNAVLTITNWQGTANQQSDVTKLLFGTGGLTSTQLAQVRFADQNIDGGQLLGAQGELAPIPEAPVVWGAAAIAAFIFWRERHRLFGLWRTTLSKQR